MRAVQHADMLDSGRKRRAPRRAVVEAAIVGVELCVGSGHTADHAQRLFGHHLRLERAADDQQVARAVAWRVNLDARREHRDADTRSHRRVGLSVTHDDVRCHRMPDDRVVPTRAGQAACERTQLGHRGHQRAQARVLIGQAAAHRSRIAAVAREIEGDRHIAVAGQREREGLHQLLRAGETVRDQHHRRSGCAGRRAEHGDRRRTQPLVLDRHTVGQAFEPRHANCDGEQRKRGHQPRRPCRPAPRRAGAQLCGCCPHAMPTSCSLRVHNRLARASSLALADSGCAKAARPSFCRLPQLQCTPDCAKLASATT